MLISLIPDPVKRWTTWYQGP